MKLVRMVESCREKVALELVRGKNCVKKSKYQKVKVSNLYPMNESWMTIHSFCPELFYTSRSPLLIVFDGVFQENFPLFEFFLWFKMIAIYFCSFRKSWKSFQLGTFFSRWITQLETFGTFTEREGKREEEKGEVVREEEGKKVTFWITSWKKIQWLVFIFYITLNYSSNEPILTSVSLIDTLILTLKLVLEREARGNSLIQYEGERRKFERERNEARIKKLLRKVTREVGMAVTKTMVEQGKKRSLREVYPCII